MDELQTAPTSALSPEFLRELRALLDAAFPNDFSDDDWDHSIGGTHVWVAGPSGLISHASLVERTVTCSGTSLRVGYVEAVATDAAQRRKGHGARVMARVAELIRAAHSLGVLSSTTHAFYASLGWETWRGLTHVAAPDGLRRTPGDDGEIMVLRTPSSPPLDLDGDIVCDWRAGDVW